MRAYFAYDTGGMEELGETSQEQIPSLIARADASLSTDNQFGVGLYRSDDDFVEIRPVGNGEYLIWSDIIAVGSDRGFLSLLFGRKQHIDKVVAGRDLATAAAYDYMERSRAEFERRYG